VHQALTQLTTEHVLSRLKTFGVAHVPTDLYAPCRGGTQMALEHDGQGGP
jgi:hypothetical protein